LRRRIPMSDLLRLEEIRKKDGDIKAFVNSLA